MAMKIIKGDDVVVICGSSRGSTGKVINISRKNGRVLCLVSGVNLRNKRTSSGVVLKEYPVDISNVMLWDKGSRSPSRVGFKWENGKKVRFLKISGAVLSA